MVDTWQITGDGFHFGKQGLGQEETSVAFPSDSLFAAILHRLVERRGSNMLEEFIAHFKENHPPFVISSTFPFAGEVRFYPFPVGVLRAIGETRTLRIKDLKKVQYVSEAVFLKLLSGAPPADLYAEVIILQGGAVWVSRSETTALPHHLQKYGGDIWSVEQRPRVTLERSTQKSSIFFTGRVVYAEECGLWFAIHWLEPGLGLKSEISWILTDLGDSGLGGERSVGFGACKIVPGETITLPLAKNQLWINLSRYLPHPDEKIALLDQRAAYNLVSVGGWLDSNIRRGQRRRAINMISEGSLLGPVERAVPGQIVDVRPRYPTDPDPLTHPVYRCGLALAVAYSGGK